MISHCNNCKHYWQDVKYCIRHEIHSFISEFEKIDKDKCFEKKEELEIDEIYDKGRRIFFLDKE